MKNPHAVALGKLGGKNSRKNLTKEEASELGKNAMEKRKWRPLKVIPSSHIDNQSGAI